MWFGVAAALAFWCAASASVGLVGLGVAPSFVVVAACAARRRHLLAGGVVALTGLSVLVATQDWRDAVVAASFAALTAGTGVILGAGIDRRRTYGRIVAATTAALFAVHAGFVATNWAKIEESARRYQANMDAELGLAESPAESGTEPDRDERAEAPPSEASREYYEMYRWVISEWPSLLLGSTFATFLVGVCLVLSGLSWWVRRFAGLAGPREMFMTMRPPDWLVWVVILTALCWFGDRQWPGTLLKPVSWNMGVGLAAVYWLNSLGILAYGVSVLQPGPLMVGLMVVSVVYLGVWPVAVVGLFDTWFEWRKRLAAVAAARKARRDLEGPGA